MRAFLALAPAVLVAGCPGADPLPTVYAGIPILPVKTLQLGQVYRTDAPNKGGGKMTYVINLCPDDFLKTPALKEIASKYATPGFVETGGSSTETRNVAAKAGVSGVDFSFASL